MSISQYNYEAYFLDYHEGNLDAQATKELMLFLAMHPELQQEFESFEAVTLNDIEEIKFENKESLKRSVTPVNASNFDELAVEYVEGTLNPTLTKELLTFIKLNPKYEQELETYKLTKLTPDTSIFFEDKESLKRSGRRPAAYFYWSAAASVAILIAAYFIVNTNKQPSTTIAATNTKPDTIHNTIQNIQPATNSVAPQNIAQNNSDVIAPKNTKATRITHRKSQLHKQEESVAVISNNNNKPEVPVQHIQSTVKHDTVISPALDKFIAVKTNDTAKNNSVAQQEPVQQNPPANLNPETHESKSVFSFASNTVKGIGKLFKHGGVEFHKYYSKEDSSKVIAYQITLGDNRYTLAKKNSLY